MCGYLLSCYGHSVYLSDMEDWRAPQAQQLEFLQTEIEAGLIWPDEYFDFIYSYNTFEHLKDPKTALTELLRVTKRGGLIYLNFAPLYASAWGLHAYRTLKIPYIQFLFSEAFIQAQKPLLITSLNFQKPLEAATWSIKI